MTTFLPTEPRSPSDVDLFIGAWNVSHRWLKERLTGCRTLETHWILEPARR